MKSMRLVMVLAALIAAGCNLGEPPRTHTSRAPSESVQPESTAQDEAGATPQTPTRRTGEPLRLPLGDRARLQTPRPGLALDPPAADKELNLPGISGQQESIDPRRRATSTTRRLDLARPRVRNMQPRLGLQRPGTRRLPPVNPVNPAALPTPSPDNTPAPAPAPAPAAPETTTP